MPQMLNIFSSFRELLINMHFLSKWLRKTCVGAHSAKFWIGENSCSALLRRFPNMWTKYIYAARASSRTLGWATRCLRISESSCLWTGSSRGVVKITPCVSSQNTSMYTLASSRVPQWNTVTMTRSRVRAEGGYAFINAYHWLIGIEVWH